PSPPGGKQASKLVETKPSNASGTKSTERPTSSKRGGSATLARSSKATTGKRTTAVAAKKKKKKRRTDAAVSVGHPSVVVASSWTKRGEQFEEIRARNERYSAPSPPVEATTRDVASRPFATVTVSFSGPGAPASMNRRPRRPWEWTPQDCKAVAQRAMAGTAGANGGDVGGVRVLMAADPVVLFDSDDDDEGCENDAQEKGDQTTSWTSDSGSGGDAWPSHGRAKTTAASAVALDGGRGGGTWTGAGGPPPAAAAAAGTLSTIPGKKSRGSRQDL
ncbi:unnamed protein product, partial [Ectocarpus sp. 12 AP-2014]